MSRWCFIACFSLTCYLVSGQNEKYVLVGKKVDFTGFSDIKGSPADILWKHIRGHIGHKVVHFDSSQEQSFGSYEGRVTLNWRSADLSISNLRYEDSGEYVLEILFNHNIMTKRYQLTVIDRVTKPKITCEINDASTAESAGSATLLCSLPSHSDKSSLKFQWSTNGKIDLGDMLKISLGGEFDDRQYNCTVNNPLTQDSAVFIAKDCYPETKAQAGLIAGVVGGVVFVVLLLIILLMVFYLKKVRSNRRKSVVETQSNSEFSKVTPGSEETEVLLNRAPTIPSHHNLGHLNQRNDTPLDSFQKDSEKNKVQDSCLTSPSVKEVCSFFEEIGKANESEPRKVEEEEVLEEHHSDSEPMNPGLITLSPESSPEKNKDEENKASHPPPVAKKPNLDQNFSASQKAAENTNPDVIKQQVLDDPADSGNPNEMSNDQSPEKNKDEDNKASHPPPVAKKPNLDLNFSASQKAAENTNPDVIKQQVLDDPADSGNPNEMSNDQSPEKNKDEENKASHPPMVTKKPNLDPNFSASQKAAENTNPDVIKQQVLDDPADSGNPNEMSNDQSPEKNKDEDNKASHPPPVAKKPNLDLNFSASQKAAENTNPDVIKQQVLDDPADSGNPNEMSNDQSPEKNKDEDNKASHPPMVTKKPNLDQNFSASQKAAENTNPDVIKQQVLDDPADSGNPNEVSNDQSPEKNKDEDNKASHPPPVAKKPNLGQNFYASQKAAENTNSKVIKQQVLDDPADSGNPNEMSNDQNSGSKKEENEFAKSTPENDVQPPPVAKENSPLSQNSPESSPKAEHKQDINSDECAMTSSGKSSSSSLEKSEDEEQVPPASTPKMTDSETTVEEQKPALSEPESEMETLQNK